MSGSAPAQNCYDALETVHLTHGGTCKPSNMGVHHCTTLNGIVFTDTTKHLDYYTFSLLAITAFIWVVDSIGNTVYASYCYADP